MSNSNNALDKADLALDVFGFPSGKLQTVHCKKPKMYPGLHFLLLAFENQIESHSVSGKEILTYVKLTQST